jgi:hypothetical protein
MPSAIENKQRADGLSRRETTPWARWKVTLADWLPVGMLVVGVGLTLIWNVALLWLLGGFVLSLL